MAGGLHRSPGGRARCDDRREHAAGNYRVLCGLCSELLAAACEREVKHLDEKLFLEITSAPVPQARASRANGKDARR